MNARAQAVYITAMSLLAVLAFTAIIAYPSYYTAKGTRVLRDHCIAAHGNWTGGQCRFYAEAKR